MNRAFTLVAPAFLAGFGVPIEASAAERIFSISDFQRIRVIGPFRVDVIADRLTTVRGKGSNDALDRVRLDVQGQTLFVRLDRTNFGGAEDKGPPAVITIRAPALREASLAGNGALSLTGMKGLRVGVVVEGSGSLSATNVQADRMDIGVVGTGTVTLSGKARNAIVTGRGAGSVKGSALSVGHLGKRRRCRAGGGPHGKGDLYRHGQCPSRRKARLHGFQRRQRTGHLREVNSADGRLFLKSATNPPVRSVGSAAGLTHPHPR